MSTNSSFNLTPHMSEYTWRAVRRDDIPAIGELTAAAVETDKSDAGSSEGWLAQILDMLGDRVETDTIAAESADGTLAAIAFIYFPPAQGEHLAMLEGMVHVAHRGRGLGSVVLGWMENRAQEEFSQFNDDLQRMMRMSCADHLTDRITLFEQHGFEAVRYAYKMQRDLQQPIFQAPLPTGLRIVHWSKERDMPMMNTFNEAFKEHWGLPQMNEELWKHLFTAVPQFRADLTTLALDSSNDAIAGFCLNWVNAEKNEQTGVQEGWIEAVGTIPSWRGRGLATALMVQSLNDFIAQGFDRAALDVDTQNPTGALRLYEKLGFEAVKRTIIFAKG